MAAKLAVLLGIVLPLAASAARGEGGLPSADQLVKEAKTRARATPSVAAGRNETPEVGGLWGAFSTADLPALRKAGVPLYDPVASGGGAAVFRMSKDDLPAISRVMHEQFNRCGGFFASDTRSKAEAALAPAPAAAKAVEYTIDQQAWLRPIL